MLRQLFTLSAVIVTSASVSLSSPLGWQFTNPSATIGPARAVAADPDSVLLCGEGGEIVSTSDFQTWTTHRSGTLEGFANATHFKGVWCVWGNSGAIFTSRDLQTWQQRTNEGTAGRWAEGNGTLVALTGNGSSLRVTTDGENWTSLAIPDPSGNPISFTALAFAHGKFWLGAYGNNRVFSSTDGVSWTENTTSSPPGSFLRPTFAGGNGHLLAIHFAPGDANSTLYELAADGTWTSRTTPKGLQDLVFVHDRFLLRADGFVYASADGVDWVPLSVQPPTSRIERMAHSELGWFIVAPDGSVFRSFDLTTWEPVTKTRQMGRAGVTFTGGRFVSSSGLESIDGRTWERTGFQPPIPTDLTYLEQNVSEANGRTFLTIAHKTAEESVPTLQLWDITTRGAESMVFEHVGYPGAGIGGVSHGQGRYAFIFSDQAGTSFPVTSPDAVNWTVHQTLVGIPGPSNIAGSDGTAFYGMSGPGEVFASTDGATWTQVFVSSYGVNLRSVVAGPGFVFFGTSRVETGTANRGYYYRDQAGEWTYHAGYHVLAAAAEGENLHALVQLPQGGYAVADLSGRHTWSLTALPNVSSAPAFSVSRGNDRVVLVADDFVLTASATPDCTLQTALPPVTYVAPGDLLTVRVDTSSSGTAPIHYQWTFDGVDVAGATGTGFDYVQPDDAYWRRIGVWITCGTTRLYTETQVSVQASLAPKFSSTATDVGIWIRYNHVSTASFSSSLITAAYGAGGLTYDWYRNGIIVQSSPRNELDGGVGPNDVGDEFRVVVRNAFGEISSDTFVVQPPLPTGDDLVALFYSNRPPTVARLDLQIANANFVQHVVWRHNGQVVAETSGPFLAIENPSTEHSGFWDAIISNAWGTQTITSRFVTLSHGELSNVSVRAWAGTGDATLTPGIVLAQGRDPGRLYRQMQPLVRAIGPGLGKFDVTETLPDPELSLVDAFNQTFATNRRWDAVDAAPLANAFQAVGAFPLESGSADAALISDHTPFHEGFARFSAPISSATGTPGEVLAEVYRNFSPGAVDSIGQPHRIINLSCRAQVAPGRPLIAGFVVDGSGPITLLLRAVGPTLGDFGITTAMPNPRLVLRNRIGLPIASNDDWSQAQNRSDLEAARSLVGGFDLRENSKDAAILVTLDPGVYTAEVESGEGLGGIALVELYEVP